MYTQQVTATHKDKPTKQYVWTDDSEQSLEDWKAKINTRFPNLFTFTDLEDNPEISKQALLKAEWQKVTDPAAKKLLRLLLKGYIEDLQ